MYVPICEKCLQLISWIFYNILFKREWMSVFNLPVNCRRENIWHATCQPLTASSQLLYRLQWIFVKALSFTYDPKPNKTYQRVCAFAHSPASQLSHDVKMTGLASDLMSQSHAGRLLPYGVNLFVQFHFRLCNDMTISTEKRISKYIFVMSSLLPESIYLFRTPIYSHMGLVASVNSLHFVHTR